MQLASRWSVAGASPGRIGGARLVGATSWSGSDRLGWYRPCQGGPGRCVVVVAAAVHAAGIAGWIGLCHTLRPEGAQG